jgi:hypothetical protein
MEHLGQTQGFKISHGTIRSASRYLEANLSVSRLTQVP